MSTTCGGLTLPDAGEIVSSGSVTNNFTLVLSNQQGATAPVGPLTGQTWYDTSVSLLKVWNGTVWTTISGGGGSTGATGVTGVIGGTGATGPGGVGSSGATGSSGVNGSAGFVGVTGNIGITGATGVSSPGSTGVTGSIGSNGTAGVGGSPGATGSVAPSLILLDTWSATTPTSYDLPVVGPSPYEALDQWVNVPFDGSATINNIGATFSTQTQTFSTLTWGPWPTFSLPSGTYYVNAKVNLGKNLTTDSSALIALCESVSGNRILYGVNTNYGGATIYDMVVDGTFTLATTTSLVFRVRIPNSGGYTNVFFRHKAEISWSGEPNYSGIFSSAQFYKIS